MDHKRLALVHIVKRELGLADEAYRAILQREAGVQSARDLSEEGFRRLMRFLVRSRHYRLNPAGLTLRQKLYIDHLRDALGWDESHLCNFLRKYFKHEAVGTLARAEASRVIVALRHVAATQRHPNQPCPPLPRSLQ